MTGPIQGPDPFLWDNACIMSVDCSSLQYIIDQDSVVFTLFLLKRN